MIAIINCLPSSPRNEVDVLAIVGAMLIALFVLLFFYALIADEYDGTVKDNSVTPMYQNRDILLQESLYNGEPIPTHAINSTWGKIFLIVLAIIIIISYPSYSEFALYR